MLIKDSHPVLSLIIQGNNFEGLVDTGVDVSVISSQQWPQDWEKEKSPLMLTGLGSTADGDCNHKIKRRLLLGREVMANLDRN